MGLPSWDCLVTLTILPGSGKPVLLGQIAPHWHKIGSTETFEVVLGFLVVAEIFTLRDDLVDSFGGDVVTINVDSNISFVQVINGCRDIVDNSAGYFIGKLFLQKRPHIPVVEWV
jgi:hypothetical protein